jgi:hypothetical protein
VTLRGRQTILYVISPRCIWCARNTANVAALYQQKVGDYSFVGLSLDEKDLAAYLGKHSIPFKVYVAKPETIAAYGLGATPSTIVVDAGGLISQKFNGAWLKSQAKVESFFGIKLPGLLSTDL